MRRAAYDVEQTIRAYDGLGLDAHTVEVLAEILRTGGHMPSDQSEEVCWQAFYRAHLDKLETVFSSKSCFTNGWAWTRSN